MSRMQDALFPKDHDCAKPAVPVADLCETDTQDGSLKSCQGDTLRRSDHSKLRRNLILWIVPKSPTRSDRPAAERTARLKSKPVGGTIAQGTRSRSQSKRLSALRKESVPGTPLQKGEESVAAQIRRFQEGADLRECLLPGMLRRISPKACEGWQRQTSVRNSRMMAKIKLEPCKRCQYGILP
jgi:hypothetical protein